MDQLGSLSEYHTSLPPALNPHINAIQGGVYDPWSRSLSVEQTVELGNTPLNRNWFSHIPAWTGVMFNPCPLSIDTLELMYRTDETINAGIRFKAICAISRLGKYSHPNPDIQNDINDIIANIPRWHEFLSNMLLAPVYGSVVAEICWDKYFDDNGRPKVRIESLEPLSPRSITYVLRTYDSPTDPITGVVGKVPDPQSPVPNRLDANAKKLGIPTSNLPGKNRLSHVVQWINTTWQVDLPVEKCVIFVNQPEFGNPYGQTDLQACLKSWYIKDQLLRAWAICLQRYGTPLANVTTKNPDQYVTVPGTSTKMRQADYLVAVLARMSSSSSFIHTADVEVEFQQASRALGKDFELAIQYLNEAILRALRIPPLTGGGKQAGAAAAVGRKHFDIFALSLDDTLQCMVECLMEQIVKRCIRLNWKPEEHQYQWGKWDTKPLEEEDFKLISEMLLNMANSGWMSSLRLSDVNLARERAELPLIPADDEVFLAMQKAGLMALQMGTMAPTATNAANNGGAAAGMDPVTPGKASPASATSPVVPGSPKQPKPSQSGASVDRPKGSPTATGTPTKSGTNPVRVGSNR